MKGLIEILLELFLIKFQVDSPVFFIQILQLSYPSYSRCNSTISTAVLVASVMYLEFWK